MKSVIYARVSTTKQELNNQLNELRKYIDRMGWENVGEYKEIVTGYKVQRKQFNKLFEDAHKRKFDVVLFWDLTRFSRSGTLYTLQKLRELDNLKIAWHSYNEPYISSVGEFKDIVLALLSTMAKLERDKISERTKAGLERVKLMGGKIGRQKGAKDKKKRKRRYFKAPKHNPPL